MLLVTSFVTSCLLGAAQQADADEGLVHALDAVAVVNTPDGTGTAFVVGPGTLLTANHVVKGSTTFQLQPTSGQSRTATVVRTDAANDLAVLHADTADLPVLAIRSTPAVVGEDVYAAGAALGTPSVSRGVVSGRRIVDGVDHLQTDAAVNPGISGGPLLDDHDQVVGLVVAKLSKAEGVGLAVPADRLRALLDGAPAEGPAGTTGDDGSGGTTAAPPTAPGRSSGTPIVATAALVGVSAGGALLLGLNLRRRSRACKSHPSTPAAPLARPIPSPMPPDDDLVVVLHPIPDRPTQED